MHRLIGDMRINQLIVHRLIKAGLLLLELNGTWSSLIWDKTSSGFKATLGPILDQLIAAQGCFIINIGRQNKNILILGQGIISGDQGPAFFPASMTTVAKLKALMIRLRQGKFCFKGGMAQANSETTAPCREILSIKGNSPLDTYD
jgi:hypothetical protein